MAIKCAIFTLENECEVLENKIDNARHVMYELSVEMLHMAEQKTLADGDLIINAYLNKKIEEIVKQFEHARRAKINAQASLRKCKKIINKTKKFYTQRFPINDNSSIEFDGMIV